MIPKSYLWPAEAQPEIVHALQQGASGEFQELAEEMACGGQLEQVLRQAAPAAIRLPGGALLAVESQRGANVTLLAPDQSRKRVRLDSLADTILQAASLARAAEITATLDACGLRGPRRERALRMLLADRLQDIPVCQVCQLRTHPGSSFAEQLSQAQLLRRLAAFAAAHLLDYGLWLLSWLAIGETALAGRLDSARMLGWALILATIIPVRLWVTWSQGVLALGAGGLLKQRLLAGALNLDADFLRGDGAGRTLSRTLEAESLESLALTGGMAAFLAVLELSAAWLVLWNGASGWRHPVLLAVWVALTIAASYWYVRRRSKWTVSRLDMTHRLVERMGGHRTRLAQEPPGEWHAGEDDGLAGYAVGSRRMDFVGTLLMAVVPRGWELAALALLLPFWIDGHAPPAALAITLGGIVLAGQSLRRLSAGFGQLAAAAIAWREVGPLFHCTARPSADPSPSSGCGETVLQAMNLVFRYRPGAAPVLQGCSLRIRRGDFVLLEGESGSGKSTLASLLAGLRRPNSGTLLAGGLDLASIGERGWRRRVAAAPQFHENHVLSAPLAFNLLMSRNWPPSPRDLEEAEAVCRELGLGLLLERMPGGLLQMVGETGWQLSQGEKSRVFLARALLQGADLVVLDESFAALDPESLRQYFECVSRRVETLMVIAHP